MDFTVAVKEAVFTDTNHLPDGRYVILRRLGYGASGEVFLTEHTGLHVYRAVKRIQKSMDRYHTGTNEVNLLKSLSHPSLPIIYDIYEDSVYFYIVEEYVQGKTLREYVAEHGHLTEKQAVEIGLQLCTVLDYMQIHGGICHLDLKPDNIIVTDGNIKLLDFGSGLMAATVREAVLGTKGYAAPEMYHNGSIDRRADIYAVGMILIFMLTGSPDTDIKQTKINLSETLLSIIQKCISYDKAGRYAGAEELSLALKKSQIQFKATENPMLITVSGCTERIGTTHLSAMLASYLGKYAGRKCALFILQHQKSVYDALPLYAATKKVKYDAGVYDIDGVNVILDYDGFACVGEEALKESRFIVVDCGRVDAETLSKEGFYSQIRNRILDSLKEVMGYENENDFEKNIINIVVAGHTERELADYDKAAVKLKTVEIPYITAVNFTDGSEYIRIRKEHGMKKAFRIPYCTNPFAYKGRSMELEKTIFSQETGKHKNHRHWRFIRRLWGNTFSHSHCNVYVKDEEEKHCDS